MVGIIWKDDYVHVNVSGTLMRIVERHDPNQKIRAQRGEPTS
jgi:hypothetical protein